MSALAEFVLARTTADEERYTREIRMHRDSSSAVARAWVGEMTRGLAECRAKRRIVEHFADVVDAGFEQWDGGVDARLTLGHLAAIYADHPDYDEAWRP